jgi:hypothetical protein
MTRPMNVKLAKIVSLPVSAPERVTTARIKTPGSAALHVKSGTERAGQAHELGVPSVDVGLLQVGAHVEHGQ